MFHGVYNMYTIILCITSLQIKREKCVNLEHLYLNVSIQNNYMASQVGTNEGFGDFLVYFCLIIYQTKSWMVGRYI